MKKNKLVIYSDDPLYYTENFINDIKESLECNELEINDNNIFEETRLMSETDFEQLKDAVEHFDQVSNNKILVVGSLGLWYGQRTGQAIYNSLEECYSRFTEDTNTFYFEKKNTTLTLKAIHHDGTNKFKFYELTKKGKRAITFERLYNL